MTGVEILASAQVATEFAFNWAGFWTIEVIGVVFGLILGIILVFTDDIE